jgi:hypothetical protein
MQQTTSNISLTSMWEILSLTGEPQIPVPLGHLSLLVFDSLPGAAKIHGPQKTESCVGRRMISITDLRDDRSILYQNRVEHRLAET